MEWYWVVIIIGFLCVFSIVGSTYFYEIKPEQKRNFKKLFGILPSEEKIRVEDAVNKKIIELVYKWREKFWEGDEDGMKKTKEDINLAKQMAHRFKIEGY